MSLLVPEGQPRAARILKGALGSGKVSHAYLFHGPAGVGKATAARHFVMALLCPQTREQACGECSSCRRVLGGNHPDLQVLSPELDGLGIAQVRSLIRFLSSGPYQGPVRCALILDSDQMNRPAANALLKTLEDPPVYTRLLLTTDNPAHLLSTVISRCQSVPFGPLPHDVLEKLLSQRGFSAERASLAAALAGGSITRAMEMDGLLADDDGGLLALTRALMGQGRSDREGGSRTAVDSSSGIRAAVELRARVSRSGEGQRGNLVQQLTVLLCCLAEAWGKPAESRNNYPGAAGGTGRWIEEGGTYGQVLANLAGYSPSVLGRLGGYVMETKRAIEENANIGLALEALFLRWREAVNHAQGSRSTLQASR
ncbi:MAG: DNA polymerase III subunit delta' [Firmicutes bacterium]|nr:DNA polymerase III subunit delta' [Bacillota bacterium]